MRVTLLIRVLILSSLALASCKGGAALVGGAENGKPYDPDGAFLAVSINVEDGQVWELNRPIRITFNHPVDPTTVDFATIQIRAMDAAGAGHPVTGSFEIEDGEDGRVVVFRPICPTDDENSNGSFLGGGIRYELSLPTEGSGAATVLRDTEGRPLETGIRVEFVTPQPPTQPLFLDLAPGPPRIVSVDFPSGLNLFSMPDPIIRIQFDQSIDGSPSNLNTNNLYVRFSAGEIGSGQEDVFPAENMIPGKLVLVENCVASGATVDFVVTGILPPNRKLRLEMTSQFRDIVGQANAALTVWPPHTTPTLAAIYDDPSWIESSETVDEFRDDYDTSAYLDMNAPIPLPFATVGDGYVAASFDYPGSFVSDDADFYVSSPIRELFTDSSQPFTDDNGRQHVLENGVLNVNDFIIEEGAVVRARGKNPLIIYATGDVIIDGVLDVSGNNSTWPTALQSPQFAVGGALGECGGGQGGDASQITDAETPRAETGDGPFGLEHGGGQGGEGVYADGKYASATASWVTLKVVAAGGGGGGFARTLNESIFWAKWPNGTDWKPAGVDNIGPDHKPSRHPQVDVVWVPDPTSPIYGAEDGLRGSTADNTDPPDCQCAVGGWGMEDFNRDLTASEDTGGTVDPQWTSGNTPPFEYGHPTDGPDPGAGGPSVFTDDGDLKDDFWGRRLNADGTVTVGELAAPWAGSGGGGGGDSVTVNRIDTNGDGIPESVQDFIPIIPFQSTSSGSPSTGWVKYRKGAGGGGGGGQLMIFAIGTIKFGPSSALKANGGVGFAGESVIYVNNSISGSGGGSGGHIVLHSTTAIDFSELTSIGVANTAADVGNLVPVDIVQAFGGRRGWSSPSVSGNDGNGDFHVGRGGAGANGVIQIHVPNPRTDIIWPPLAAPGILDYIGNPVDTDKLEEMLSLMTAPQAYALIPFFSSASMVQSTWIDTGLAGLRLSPDPDQQNWTYPKFAEAMLRFDGIGAGGIVQKVGETVAPLGNVATGPNSAAQYDGFSLVIPNASAHFAAEFLRNPALLVGYDVLPNANGAGAYEIVSADYDRGSDRLTLQTLVADGPLEFAIGGAPEWAVRQKFFRIDTSGLKDSLPNHANVYFSFQGAKERTPGSNEPGDPFPGPNQWTSDLSQLDGYRFIRYRLTFDADANGTGIDLSTPLPQVNYVKIPFVW